MLKLTINILYSSLLLCFFACEIPPSSTGQTTSPSPTTDSNIPMEEKVNPPQVPYYFDQPDAILELEQELVEISGLSFSKDESQLIAVQDEKGYIYSLNKTTGAIEDKVKFWKKGDYEGVEVIGDRTFVLKNTGTLYELNTNESPQALIKHKNFLSQNDDVEGLGYDAKNNRLLLACKARTGTQKDTKEIFGFDLDSMQISEKAIFEIKLSDIKKHLEQNQIQNKTEELMKFFLGAEGELTFAPSGIAVHPINQDLYIISSVGKLLVQLDKGGQLKAIHKLDKKIHRQPEGIVFAKDGTLYISNEGKKGTAKIIRYNYKE